MFEEFPPPMPHGNWSDIFLFSLSSESAFSTGSPHQLFLALGFLLWTFLGCFKPIKRLG
jgi:hypothetical protein